MCDYQGYEFGAGRYPDSVCFEGRLLDADNCDGDGNVYDNSEDIPCPMCRREEAIQWWTDRNSSFVDDDDDEETSIRKARDAATSLVDDIRRNRGIEHSDGVTSIAPSTELAE